MCVLSGGEEGVEQVQKAAKKRGFLYLFLFHDGCNYSHAVPTVVE